MVASLSTLRQEVWHSLIEIDRHCRYYETVHSRAMFKHTLIRVLTLLLIAGVVTPIVDLIPIGNEIVRASLFSLATGLTIVDAIVNFNKKAATAHAIYVNCDRLRVEWRNLWLSVADSTTDVDTGKLQQQMLDLSYRTSEVKGWASASDFTPDGKLNEQTARDSYRVVEARYRVGS